LFASGRIVGAARPLPEFFWQYHVFVDPVLAAKYPPGHAAILAAGALIGAPWLIPLVAASLCMALLFVFAARWSSRSAGFLAVGLAASSGVSLRFWPSYFSETTTAALFVVAWYALAEYWEHGRIRWLLLLALAVGVGGITRPMTMLAFAIPAAVMSIVAVRRHASWRHLIPAGVLAIAVVASDFVWNDRVTGDWRQSPHTLYARRFIPSDRVGFGLSEEAPADSLPQDLERFDGMVRRLHVRHTLANLPRIAASRASRILQDTWPYMGVPAALAVVGLLVLPIGLSLVVLATVLGVFGGYLLYAHIPSWTLYYLELQAPLAFLTAAGVQAASMRAATMLQRFSNLQPATLRRALSASIAAFLLLPATFAVPGFRAIHQEAQNPAQAFAQAIQHLSGRKAIVFVSEHIEQHPERSAVQNVIDLESAPIWIAHDLGRRDSLLIAKAWDRTAYLAIETGGPNQTQFRIKPLALPGKSR